MPRTNDWDISVLDSTGTYVLDTTIPRPNESITVERQSTKTKIQLADGSLAIVTPETKYTEAPMQFVWHFVADTDNLLSTLQTYQANGDVLKIESHNGSYIFYGYFASVSGEWLVGVDEDIFEITATLERIIV